MHKMFFGRGVLAALLIAGCAKAAQAESLRIAPVQEEIQWVDVRDPRAFAVCHRRDALNIPLDRLARRLPSLLRKGPVGLMGSGLDDDKLYALVREHGDKGTVRILDGGLAAWITRGGATVGNRVAGQSITLPQLAHIPRVKTVLVRSGCEGRPLLAAKEAGWRVVNQADAHAGWPSSDAQYWIWVSDDPPPVQPPSSDAIVFRLEGGCDTLNLWAAFSDPSKRKVLAPGSGSCMTCPQ